MGFVGSPMKVEVWSRSGVSGGLSSLMSSGKRPAKLGVVEKLTSINCRKEMNVNPGCKSVSM